jgi:glycosyltransferase involved in cell wall biosynthesis
MSPAQDTSALRVSVVIPTYKRPALLQRCLLALLNQNLPAERFEVLVVDDGQTDDTRALVDALAEQMRHEGGPALHYLRPLGTRGPAGARNRGWRAARADLVAFTDDDTVPDPHWLREGLRAFAPGRVAAWGHVHVPLPPVVTDHARVTAGLERARFVTANCFVRRGALVAVGGFDERYTRAWREDTDLYFALLRAFPHDDAIVSAPAALVLHPVREAPFALSMKQQANMAFDALLFKKYPTLYRRFVGRRHAPPLYYAVAAATATMLAGWLLGRPPLALGGALVAGALILLFTLQRLRGTSKSPRHVAEMLVTSAAIPFLSLYWRLAGAWRWRTAFY